MKLRFCLICSFPSLGVDLCHVCIEVVRGFGFGPFEFESHGLPCVSLLSWTYETSSWVRPLVYSYKNQTNKAVWRPWAERLLFSLNEVAQETVLVVPPSKCDEGDHALGFANALSEVIGAEVFSPFIYEQGVGSQKSKNYDQRAGKKFKLKPGPNFLKPNMSVIFVDDLITTGFTLRAVYDSLQKPQNFFAISLAIRPRLASL